MTANNGGAKPQIVKAGDLLPTQDEYPRMKARWLIPASTEGWYGTVISEWELKAAGFADLHTHDELAYVLEGELHIESGGVEVVGKPGDLIRVPAGNVGSYSAPIYARMLGIYGPNPEGENSQYLKYWEID